MHSHIYRKALKLARLILAAGLFLSLFSTGMGFSSSPAALLAGSGKGPALVKDIQTMTDWSSPSGYTAVGSGFYFNACLGRNIFGCELWHSDGTPETTHMVKDLVPGPDSSLPNFLTPLDDTRVVFISVDAAYNQYISVSNGTPEGTRQLAQLSGGFNYYFNAIFNLDGLVYFIDAGHLWRTDGTAAGTKLLAELSEGSFSIPKTPFTLGGILYLTEGEHLWQSDGTPLGTKQATSLALSSTELAVFNNWLYFAAQGPQGQELYRLNPSVTEAEPVTDLCPAASDCGSGLGNASPSALAAATNRLYFAAFADNTSAQGQALWYLTAEAGSGPRLAADLAAGTSGADRYAPPIAVGNGLYFLGNNGATGNELWYTTGEPSSAAQVVDIGPGLEDGEYSTLLPYDGKLFFIARPNSYLSLPSDYALYAATGSEVVKLSSALQYLGAPVIAGSTMFVFGTDFSDDGGIWIVAANGALQRIASSTYLCGLSQSRNAGVWNGKLLFAAADPVHGCEPWISDGSAAGTKMFADLNTDPDARGSEIEHLAVIYKDAVYFPARTGLDDALLWRSDGSTQGTKQVFNFHGSALSPYFLTDAAISNNLLYFSALTSEGYYGGLWRTDGTEGGTVRLMDGYPRQFTDVGGKLFFATNNAASTTETKNSGLWVLNKDENTPTMVKEAYPIQLGAQGSDCLFWFSTGDGWELWRSDGTSAGTTKIGGQAGSWYGSEYYQFGILDEMVHFDGRLFFIAPAEPGVNTSALYATDGSTTTRITGGANTPHFPTRPFVLGNTLYFGGMNGQDAVLWKLPAGSSQASVVYTGAAGLVNYSKYDLPLPLADLNGKLVFSSDPDGDDKGQLWLSDGTPQGTQELCPACGYQVSPVPGPVVADGKLYFSASDTAQQWGRELWVSDGTNAGTGLLADLLPGPQSANPANLIVLGHKLLFTATDGDDPVTGHGNELWGYDLLANTLYLPAINKK